MHTKRLFPRRLKLGDEKHTFVVVTEEFTKDWIGWEPAKSLQEEHKRIQKFLADKKSIVFTAFTAHKPTAS